MTGLQRKGKQDVQGPGAAFMRLLCEKCSFKEHFNLQDHWAYCQQAPCGARGSIWSHHLSDTLRTLECSIRHVTPHLVFSYMRKTMWVR